MKRPLSLWRLIAVAAALAGCGPPNIEQEAKKLIVPMLLPSATMAVMTDPTGRIDLIRRVKAADGVHIDVWVISSRRFAASEAQTQPANRQRIARGTVVQLPPLLTCKTWFLNLGELLTGHGWDVVLIDHRAHGWSEGKYVTWGAKEKHDVKAVVDELVGEKAVHADVYAVGASMGGAVAIQYAAIDPRCKGVLAIAPPAGARQIGRRILLMLSEDDYEAALKRAGEIAGFDPADADTVAAAGQLKCPLLLVHGLLDWAVPYEHSEEIFAAARQPKKFMPQILYGHALEVWRNEWVADRIEDLAIMAQKNTDALDAPPSAAQQ